MAKIITNMGATLVPFEFTDIDGEVFASFKLNPADVRLVERLESFATKIQELKDKEDGDDDYEKSLRFTEAVENLFCELIGYDVHECLFGRISATAENENGLPFFAIILDVIGEQGGKEVAKRAKKTESAIRKYTDKYKA